MNVRQLIDEQSFRNVFSNLEKGIAQRYYNILVTASNEMGWKPTNLQEVAAFLGHVAHETANLTKFREEGDLKYLRTNYQSCDWSGIKAYSSTTYYFGRGWLHLSYPANYFNAGEGIGLPVKNQLWKTPDLVATDHTIGCKTAIWFWMKNNMGGPASEGMFGTTTKLLNSWETKDLKGHASQITRVLRYLEVRKALSLPTEADPNKLYCWQHSK